MSQWTVSSYSSGKQHYNYKMQNVSIAILPLEWKECDDH